MRISTNSLASTDAFIAYAMSYKYKRRYLRDFGFEIHEFKPFPTDAPFGLGPLGAGLAEEGDEDGADADAVAPPATAPAARRPSLRERRLAERGLRNEPDTEAGRRSPFASSGGMPVRLQRACICIFLHA